jgi:Uncharacterized protein conserved in bacteria
MGTTRKNYGLALEKILEKIDTDSSLPKLLLHVCCAPCSSYVLNYLSKYFHIILLFYNPNIEPEEEYQKRKAELLRLREELQLDESVKIMDCAYNPREFRAIARGMENEQEGGERCRRCYRLRMEEAAKTAKKINCDYFTTTLTISPMKNAQIINEIGEGLAEIYGVKHLPSDFKKKEGYKKSIQLSKEYNLYRQDFCGCEFSKKQRETQKENQTNSE